ncbi:predicted protein [Lichtheimia corymbifera JMRC:FSU:9682]|uniref:Uncharacterized protein n=1 Tax=Lichtheimia corymbifera JMRC:FSU:9682 TaxID=1263082 RepID=A0A068SCX5_9FUNG|nr:predicted protein [Lichtheimia corymbifera JMRC:FSU:9682]
MDGPISAIKYPANQALFALLSCTENTKEERDQHSDGKRSISAAIKAIFAIKCSNVESWNVALATWLVVSSNEHVDTAEDDDGLDELDGMETRAYIFDKRGFTTMDDITTFSQCMQQLLFTIMDEDA